MPPEAAPDTPETLRPAMGGVAATEKWEAVTPLPKVVPVSDRPSVAPFRGEPGASRAGLGEETAAELPMTLWLAWLVRAEWLRSRLNDQTGPLIELAGTVMPSVSKSSRVTV